MPTSPATVRQSCRRLPGRLALIVCLAALSACSQPLEWREMDLGPVVYEDAWSAIERAVEVDGFRTDEGGSDRGLRRYQTRWRSRVGVGFGPGVRSTRTRLLAEFETLEAAETPGWRLRYCVERQQVLDIAKTMDPEEQDWESAGQDVRMEERLAAKLRLRLGKPLFEEKGPGQ